MAGKQDRPNLLQQLKQELREHRLGRLYIFHGEESFLMHHYLQMIKKQLVEELTESFNYTKLTEENFTADVLADAVERLPMMAEHTFVWVDEIDPFGLPEEDRNKLIDIFHDIPDYCTVVFTFESTPWKPNGKLVQLKEAVSNNATVVEFARQDRRELINWVGRHFAAEGKQIAPDLCGYLIDLTGGSMTLLNGEIKKICAFSGADAVTRSDIDTVTEPVLEAEAFQLMNLLCAGEYDKTMDKLHKMMKLRLDPIELLGAIGLQLRQICAARALIEKGRNTEAFQKLCNIRSDYAARRTMDSAKRFSPAFCKRASELVLETDFGMKTSADDRQRLLEILMTQLIREARNG